MCESIDSVGKHFSFRRLCVCEWERACEHSPSSRFQQRVMHIFASFSRLNRMPICSFIRPDLGAERCYFRMTSKRQCASDDEYQFPDFRLKIIFFGGAASHWRALRWYENVENDMRMWWCAMCARALFSSCDFSSSSIRRDASSIVYVSDFMMNILHDAHPDCHSNCQTIAISILIRVPCKCVVTRYNEITLSDGWQSVSLNCRHLLKCTSIPFPSCAFVGAACCCSIITTLNWIVSHFILIFLSRLVSLGFLLFPPFGSVNILS